MGRSMQPAANSSIRVVLADDHDLVRSGIRALLSMMNGVTVVAEARSGAELLEVLKTVETDLVMTDISMPGMDGITAISEIRAHHPAVRIMVLSMYDSVEFIRQAVAKGACGYLMKDAPPFELEHAVRTVMAVGSYFGAGVAQKLLQPAEPTPGDELTPRQVEILLRIAKGESAKEIAFDLGLSPKTVDVHRARIMERLGLKDIASLTRYAVRKGLLKA